MTYFKNFISPEFTELNYYKFLSDKIFNEKSYIKPKYKILKTNNWSNHSHITKYRIFDLLDHNKIDIYDLFVDNKTDYIINTIKIINKDGDLYYHSIQYDKINEYFDDNLINKIKSNERCSHNLTKLLYNYDYSFFDKCKDSKYYSYINYICQLEYPWIYNIGNNLFFEKFDKLIKLSYNKTIEKIENYS